MSDSIDDGVVDCAVHPQVTGDEIRERLPEPWRSRSFPSWQRAFYVHPESEFAAEFESGLTLPGSDPEIAVAKVFGQHVEHAILVPPGRNLQPEPDMEAAICSAINEWLAERWLARDPRFWGSIRVSPRHPEAAVREIERWADHPAMVQVCVPLQAHAPYGQRQYFPIWEAAARYGLPVAVHLDPGSSIEYWPTPAGYPRRFVEYASLVSLSAAYHLTNLVAEGVFERLPALRFVLVDGGYEMLLAFSYRFNMYWRSVRAELPWLRKLPSRYTGEQVRFCLQLLDAPTSPEEMAESLAWGGGDEACLFGSHYPYWNYAGVESTARLLPTAARATVMGKNAATLYRLRERSPSLPA
jgi:predicted TIM-barrel fold metal-dependent hydrolase